MVDQRHRDLRHVGELQDRVADPVGAGDAAGVEGDVFDQRAADGLHDAAFDLVGRAVGGQVAGHRGAGHAVYRNLVGTALNGRRSRRDAARNGAAQSHV